MKEEQLEELTKSIWEEHGDELWRKTITVDIGFQDIVELVVEEYIQEAEQDQN